MCEDIDDNTCTLAHIVGAGSGAIRDHDVIENYLSRRPLRVIHMARAQDDKTIIARVLCFLGQCPVFVRTSIASGGRSIESQKMRNYFALSRERDDESSVAHVLGMNLARDVAKYMMTFAQRYDSTPIAVERDSQQQRRASKKKKGRAMKQYVGKAVTSRQSDALMGGDSEIDEITAALANAEAVINEGDDAQHGERASTSMTKHGRIGQPITFEDGSFEPIYDMQAFPEDSFMDIKRKIFASTGIPIYRQHLIGVSGAIDKDDHDAPLSIVISYALTGDARYNVDLRELYSASTGASTGALARERASNTEHTIFGIPIDDAIYESRNVLHVDARDHITMLGQTRPSFMIVIDLAEWIAPRIEKVRAASVDNYQFETLYYGFIVKYFPFMTRDVFASYLADEDGMIDRFPDLAMSKTVVNHAMRAQCEISRYTWKAHDIARGLNISHSILHASVTSQPRATDVASARTYARDINLRDFFDLIVCSKTIVDVVALVDNESAISSHSETGGTNALRYILHKMHKFSELMSTTSSFARMQLHGRSMIPKLGNEPGIIITFVAPDTSDGAHPSSPIFMVVRTSGQISFQKNWSQEASIPFDDMVTMFMRESQLLIRELRATNVFVASKIEPVTNKNMRILDLTVMTVWHNTMSARAFRNMRDSWEDYARAGIIIPKQTTKDEISFIFTRGISTTDSRQIEQRIMAAGIHESNYYAYLSVEAIRQKWNQSFAGRVVTIEHHTTSINFITADIYEDEYATFEMYLRAFVDRFARIHASQEESASASAMDKDDDVTASPYHMRNLRRLQETDPVLYNLKKYGAPRVYSSRCQHPKQPLLLTNQEIATHGVPKGAIRYWNFTTQRAAYYMCPNARYPYLNFLTGVHPLGYCIPCCGMMEPPPGSHHAQISRVCIANHTYDIAHMTSKSVGYIMSYGALDQLQDGRLSHLPSGVFSAFINRTLHSVNPSAEAIIYGVAQDVGILRAISVILGSTMSTVTMTIVRGIEKNLINFESLAGGRASTYFASRSAFIGYLTRVANGQEVFPAHTWNFMRAIITDCVRDAYNLDLMCIVMPQSSSFDSTTTRTQEYGSQLIVPRAFSYGTPRATGLIIAGNGAIHPVITIDPDDFVRHDVILSRALTTQCVATISHMIRSVNMDQSQNHAPAIKRNIDLEFIQMFVRDHTRDSDDYAGSLAIQKLYVGMRGLCYAVLLAPWNAYIPITYSSIPTQVRAQTYDISGTSLLDHVSASACKIAIEQINKYIDKTLAPFRALNIDGYITVASSIIGYVVSCASPSSSSRMIAYFDKLDTREDEYDIVMSLMTDPRKYASSIDSARSATVDISERAERALYPYYEYELFCAQFVARCATLRNQEVRARIRNIIMETKKRADLSLVSSKIERLQREIGLTNADITAIMTAVSSRELPTEQLDIDLAQLYDAIDKSREYLIKWIGDIMRNFTTQEQHGRAQHTLLVPKFITPCISQTGTGSSTSTSTSSANVAGIAHCDAKQRLILRTPISRLIDILASDLRKPIKRAYIFAHNSVPESRSMFTDFMQRSGEILVVKKVAITGKH